MPSDKLSETWVFEVMAFLKDTDFFFKLFLVCKRSLVMLGFTEPTYFLWCSAL